MFVEKGLLFSNWNNTLKFATFTFVQILFSPPQLSGIDVLL